MTRLYPPKTTREGMVIAERLLAVRRRLGYTQEEIACYFGISRAAYGRWERFGPPAGPSSRLALLMIHYKLNRRARDREAWREAKRKQRAAARVDLSLP